MKKKVIGVLCSLVAFAAIFTGCGKEESHDLNGTYKQTNSNSSDSYQVAAIDNDTISVYWYTVSDQTTALYWTGTYTAPTEKGKYSFESENYHELTDFALLASPDDSKIFTYDKGVLSYEVSMMGVTTTVTLEKSEDVRVSTQKPSGSSGTSEVPAQSTAGTGGIIVENSDNNIGISSASYNEPAASSESVEEVSEKLDISAKVTKDGQLVAFITNNSNTVIDELEVKVNYLDSNNMVIDQSSDGHDMVLPGHTVVSKMDVPSVEFADAQVEYEIQLGCYSSYENHSDDVTIASNPGDDCVMVQITNNSGVNLDEVEYEVLLYKGDDIVTISYPQDIYGLAAGQSTTEKVDVYNMKTYDSLKYGADYDRIEVYLNQAHTFGF